MQQGDLLTMSPQDALNSCGESEGLDNVAQFWEESGRAMPGERPRFLEESEWRESREWAGIDEEIDAILRRTADKIVESSASLRLAWHCYWRVFLASDACPPSGWPEFNKALGDDGGVFYLLVGLGFIPLIRQWHAQLGIPEETTRETAAVVRSGCDHAYRRAHNGLPGTFQLQIGWMRHYTRERYVRIGRFEYWLAPHSWADPVFRSRQSGQVVALAAPGTRFSAAGRIFRDAAQYKDAEGWTTSLERTSTHVSGYLLHPDGRGTPHQVTLSLDEWECQLKKGVMTLQMHIPDGGGMTPDACRDSITRSKAFFGRYFPDEPAVAIISDSWIFSPLLQKCLPETTNLVWFQRELYLLPSAAEGSDGLWNVFLKDGPPDFKTWPRETSLQRAILDYLEDGPLWGGGRMFFLLDDVPRFGQDVYRTGFEGLSAIRSTEAI